MAEQVPNDGGEPWEKGRQNILGEADSKWRGLCQKASVAGVQGAPGEMDTDGGVWAGLPPAGLLGSGQELRF